MAGALVVPVFGVGWVGNGDLSWFSLSAWWAGVGGGSRAGCSVVGGTRSPFAFRYFSFIL